MIEVGAVGTDGLRRLDAVGDPQVVVVGAVAGRGMDQAGALLGGDEAAGMERHVEIIALAVERMVGDGAGERFALAQPDRLGAAADLLLEGSAKVG